MTEELYIVRLWDGFDGIWIDIDKPRPKAEAEERCKKENRERIGSAHGKETGDFDDIDYYAVFPADTTMFFSGDRSQTGRR